MNRTPFAHQNEAVDRLRDALRAGKREIDIDGERFRPVAGFGRYLVGDHGSVFSGIRACRFMCATVGSHGYPYVSLMAEGAAKPTKMLVHRLVAMAFVANPSGFVVVNHRNGDKLDACATNLEWCSYAENNDHARRTGLALSFGETHYAAKLTDREVAEIRQLGDGSLSHREIADRFDVARQHVTKILGGHARRLL